jgi:NDP-sugar pyrophosphorylase family protein
MKAMLLAAGEGSRLPQACSYGSKVLVPVKGKPILEWNLLYLKQAGIRDIAINLCSGKEKILSFLKGHRFFGLRIAVSCEDTPLGTAGGIKNAQKLLEKKDFLVLYGDNLCNFDIARLWQAHRKNRAVGTIGIFDPVTTKHSGILAGLVRISDQGRVEKFLEKRNNQKWNGAGYVNAGIAVFSPEIFRAIPENRACDLARDIYPELLRKGRRLFAAEGATYVLASDTSEALKRTRRFYSKISGK